jgi:hypothetical protein
VKLLLDAGSLVKSFHGVFWSTKTREKLGDITPLTECVRKTSKSTAKWYRSTLHPRLSWGVKLLLDAGSLVKSFHGVYELVHQNKRKVR